MPAQRGSDDLGRRLREARQRRGLTIRQVAATTKISVPTLEALERNDVGRLPGGIFSRAFVRTYALEVGIDPESAVQAFIEQFPGASVTAGHPTDVEDHARIEGDRRIASVALWLVLGSIPVAVLVLYLAAVGRETRPPAERPAGPSSPAQPPAPAPVTAPAPAFSATTTPVPAPSTPAGLAASSAAASGRTASSEARAAASSQSAQPVEPATDAAADASAAPSADVSRASGVPPPSLVSDHLAVHIAAMRSCWVSAVVDGQQAFARLFQPGEERSLDIQREVMLSIGDAGAVVVTLNGAPARPLGRDGQVVTIRLSPENFKDYVVTQ